MLAARAEVREVRLRSPEVDLRRGLCRSPLLPWAPVEVDSSLVLRAVAEAAPLSHDVVEWMHVAAADVAVFDAMSEEYGRAGGRLSSSSGDAYIPGVRAGDVSGESVSGHVVRSRGYGRVVTPAGSFDVPARGKATFARGEVLAWASLPDPGTGVQWVLTLLRWEELARAPVRERVRFASSRGMAAPNFFHVPSTLSPVRTLLLGLTSDRRQRVEFRGRGTRGEYERVLFEGSLELEEGQSEAVISVFALPSVGAFTLELQPSDGSMTVLDYLEAFPPI